MAGKSPLSRSRARINSTAGEVVGIYVEMSPRRSPSVNEQAPNALRESRSAKVSGGLLVLEAHEFNELVVGHQPVADRDRPRPGVGAPIVHRDLHLHRAVAGSPEPLGRPGAVRQR